MLGGEPAFTSCHGRVIDTLDYIWFTPLASPRISGSDASSGGAADQPIPAHASGGAAPNKARPPHDGRMLAPEDACLGNGAAPLADQASVWKEDGGGAAAMSGGQGAPAWELVATRVALAPPLSAMRGGMPSPEYPSDHISLVAEFTTRPVQLAGQARGHPPSGEQHLHAPSFRPVRHEQQQRQVNQHLRFDNEGIP